MRWASLRAPAAELRLEHTLNNGQCFGWRRRSAEEPVWVGVLGARVLELRQTDTDTEFRCIGSLAQHISQNPKRTCAGADVETVLRTELNDYFQLERPLAPLYTRWAATDERMSRITTALPGMRVLRQEPTECLFSFICSSNNNIGRIVGMLSALRRRYGSKIDLQRPPGDVADVDAFYTFPSVDVLAAADEAELRGLGLGYRADYVLQTARALQSRSDGWLEGLRRSEDPEEVRQELCTLRGVGPKVADCVALFSLDQCEAVPVDTHVWDIACREFDPSLRECASLTPAVYARVGELFRSRFGVCSGWAHQLLFAAELPQFRSRLPEDIVEQMQLWRAEEKSLKQQAAALKKAAKLAKLAEADAQTADTRIATSPESDAQSMKPEHVHADEVKRELRRPPRVCSGKPGAAEKSAAVKDAVVKGTTHAVKRPAAAPGSPLTIRRARKTRARPDLSPER